MACFSTWVFWALIVCSTLQLERQGSLGCIEEERNALLKLKDAFNTSRLSSWIDGEDDCCTWENVNCDFSSKRVVKLSLEHIRDDSQGFTGELTSTKIQYLDLFWNELSDIPPLSKFLKYLDFADNRLTNSSRFEDLTTLNSLEYLYLGGNYLTDIPPLSKSLKYLELWGNSLTNLSRFEDLTTLNSLEYLDLSLNDLSDISPLSKSLKHLELRGNSLTNLSRFEDLTALSSLEYLDLSDNNIAGDIPSFVGALPSLESPSSKASTLKVLSLSGNQLSGSISEGICMLTNLEELDLSNNNLIGVIPSCLGNLTLLKVLGLSDNNLVGNISSTLFLNLKSLEYVSLSRNRFEGLFSFSSFSSNSKLRAFHLEANNGELPVDTESQPWTPLFQLKVLSLSNCKLNEPTGVIPSFLVSQYDLRAVILEHNNMRGQLPSWLILNNTKLEYLSLRGNLFTGRFSLLPDSRNLVMRWLDISSNQIQEEFPNFIPSALPNLESLIMSSNMFQGLIPPSLGDMKWLYILDLSNNNLSGGIPEHLSMGCKFLQVLNLSNNSLRGPLLPAKSNLPDLDYLHLGNNNFSGELSYSLHNSTFLSFLDISNNLISGEIPDWFGDFSGLRFLVLSGNSFEGHVPASFCKLKGLTTLDLARNKFGGFIPSCSNLASLKYLHLHGNNFVGPLPRTLLESPSLVTLDVRDNRLSGKIPGWIHSLTSLNVLLLKNNSFTGSIPSKICQLRNISMLDLSSNRFTGSIPSCLYWIPFGNRTKIDNTFVVFTFRRDIFYPSYETRLSLISEIRFIYGGSMEENIDFMTKRRFENYKGNILYYMSGMDLSQNKLTGQIPNDFGNLTSIHTLNLSWNHLTGSIPRTLSNLKQIESLDLSYNRLCGEIPPQLTQLTSLEDFSVAHNNLSGSLPDRIGQFGTFEESSYEGNPLLCGPPLKISCTRIGQSASPHEEEDDDDDDTFGRAIRMAFLVSYFPAFVGAVSFMYAKAYYGERKMIQARRQRGRRRMP